MFRQIGVGNLMIVVSAALALLSGCHSGGKVVGALTAPEPPRPLVDIPTVQLPASSPHFAGGDTLTIAGLCKEGSTVYLMGSAVGEVKCIDQHYSFEVTKQIDSVYTFLISQTAQDLSSSGSVIAIWVRKSSVAPPVLLSPSTNPYRSAQDVLQVVGGCETGSTITLSGETSGETDCLDSLFTIDVPKFDDGSYDIQVTQKDLAGNEASSSFVWERAALQVTPSNPTLVVATQQAFSFSGGTGSYSVTLIANPSGGSFDSTTRLYTAGTVAGVVDRLRVRDSQGTEATISIATVAEAADHFELPTDSGNNQIQTIGRALSSPMKIRVVDKYGNGVAGYPVKFKLVDGDWFLTSNSSQTTNSEGYAQATLTLRWRAITNSLSVTPANGTLPDVAATLRSTVRMFATAKSEATGRLGAVFPVGSNPGAMEIGDVDRDGNPDLVILNAGEPSLGILLGKGNGLFQAMTKIRPICSGPNGFVLQDFNKDSKLDVAIACTGSDTISILLGNGDATFANPVSAPFDATESLPSALTAADFNKDGNLDLAVTSAGSGVVGVRFGTTSGVFGVPTLFPVGLGPSAVAPADINKDGNVDLVVINAADGKIGVLLNNGAGSFGAQSTYVTGTAPAALGIGDFNLDGFDDVIVANNADNNVSIFLNDRYGVLEDALQAAVGESPSSLAIRDFNGDAKVDAAISNSADGSLTVLFSRGDGTFDGMPNLKVEQNPVSLAPGDMNKDGVVDLMVASNGNQTVQFVPGQVAGVMNFKKATGTGPVALIAGDFNSDGNLDQVVVNSGGSSATVHIGKGNGLFLEGETLVTRSSPSSALATDFNQDGKLDLAVTSETTSSFRLFLGKGNGTFESPTDYTVGTGPRRMVTADFDSDGVPDLAVSNSGSSSVSYLKGVGDGTFNGRVDFQTGSQPYDVDIADLNGDLALDMIVANNAGGSASILLGNGDGTFQAQVEYPTGVGASSIAIGFFNSDGQPDVAVANSVEGSVSILLGKSDGSLFPATNYSSGNSPDHLSLIDANGDGKQDLIVTNGLENTITVLTGAGNGQYNVTTAYEMSGTAAALEVGDFNGDGSADVSVIDGSSGFVYIKVGL